MAVAVAGAGRALGYVCAPVLLQRVAARCVGEPSDVAAYAENRRLLTEGLSALGYEYVEPDGAFYLWVRALEEDAQAFSDRAKEYELLIVPSDSFGVGGWASVFSSAETLRSCANPCHLANPGRDRKCRMGRGLSLIHIYSEWRERNNRRPAYHF